MPKNIQKAELLTKKEIGILASMKGDKRMSFSFYLGIKAGRNFVSEANSVVSVALHKIKEEKTCSKKEMNYIKKKAEEIKKTIRYLKLPNETRSMAIFFNTNGFYKIYHIPFYIPSKFILESDFYIHPLIKKIEEHPRYLVAILERDKARFIDFCMGEICEMSEIIKSDVPQRINAARFEWKGMKEGNIRGHIEDHLHRHLKKVAEKTEDFLKYKKNGFSYLVIGTHKELMEKFMQLLGAKSKEKLIGLYHTSPNYKLNQIRERSDKIIKDHERKIETKTIENLQEGASKRKSKAVFGMNLVLENLYLHNIKEVVIASNHEEPGYVCPKCHLISTYLKNCPNCKIEMVKASDLVDELIEEAITKKIEIKHLVHKDEKIDKFGVGAFLR